MLFKGHIITLNSQPSTLNFFEKILLKSTEQLKMSYL